MWPNPCQLFNALAWMVSLLFVLNLHQNFFPSFFYHLCSSPPLCLYPTYLCTCQSDPNLHPATHVSASIICFVPALIIFNRWWLTRPSMGAASVHHFWMAHLVCLSVCYFYHAAPFCCTVRFFFFFFLRRRSDYSHQSRVSWVFIIS